MTLHPVPLENGISGDLQVLRASGGADIFVDQAAISKDALKKISGEVRSWRLHRKVNYTFAGLAAMINPVVAGSPGAASPLRDVA